MQSTLGPRIFWLTVVLLAVAAVYAYFYEPAPEMIGRVRLEGGTQQAVTISPLLLGCELQFQDHQDNQWQGELALGKGKVLQILPVLAASESSFDGGKFRLIGTTTNQSIHKATIRIALLAEPDDLLTIKLKEETKQVKVADLRETQTVTLLDGKAKLVATPATQVLHIDAQVDHFAPSFGADPKGNGYLVFLANERNKGIDSQAVLSHNFDSLQQPILSTSILLSHFQDGVWQDPETVASKLENVIDPVVTVDATGRIWVAWSQKSAEGWEIFYRHKDTQAQHDLDRSWSEPKKVSAEPGVHHQLAAATDSTGKVWLAWQTWHHGEFEIFAAVLGDAKHAWGKPGPVAERFPGSQGRWHPILAADTRGNVVVAWSVFRGGQRDIECVRLSADSTASEPIPITSSSHDELHPSLICDRQNRVWIAYEVLERPIPVDFSQLDSSPSSIGVRVLHPDNRLEEAPVIPTPGAPQKIKNESAAVLTSPRLLLGPSGGVVAVFRFAESIYQTALAGAGWSSPQALARAGGGTSSQTAVCQQANHLIWISDQPNQSGLARLHFTAGSMSSPDAQPPMLIKSHTQPTGGKSVEWDKYAEKIRLFRQRPQDPEWQGRFMLRGLVVLPGARSSELAGGELTGLALDQGMFDWVLLPSHTRATISARQQSILRNDVLSRKTDRALVDGYYRPQTGQLWPTLIISDKPGYEPLPSAQEILAQIPANVDSAPRFVSAEGDRKLLEQFITQSQHMGVNFTHEWQALAGQSSPVSPTGAQEVGENNFSLFWAPKSSDATQPELAALRIVALANGKSPADLMDALRERRYYFATDDIYLQVRCERRVAGEIFQTSRVPTVNVVVMGTGKLKAAEIWRDDRIVKTESPAGAAAVLEYTEKQPDNKWHSYTVRVVQEDGAQAVTQPMWMRYLP